MFPTLVDTRTSVPGGKQLNYCTTEVGKPTPVESFPSFVLLKETGAGCQEVPGLSDANVSHKPLKPGCMCLEKLSRTEVLWTVLNPRMLTAVISGLRSLFFQTRGEYDMDLV